VPGAGTPGRAPLLPRRSRRLVHAFALAFALALSPATGLLPARAADIAEPIARPATFTLDNGLQIVVIEDHRAPIVTHMVWYRTGAADDPPGKSGIAHFLEHLMFKGTREVPAGEFDRILARNGGRGNAFTTHDYTAYFQDVAADRLGLVMKLEADRMANLAMAPEQVDPERDVILEERRMRTDNRPGGQFGEQLSAAQFLAHPYRIPVIGWEHEIRGLTRADAEDYYARHYAPNNAILVVAGDVTPDQVLALAKEHYGPVKKRDLAPRSWLEEPPQRAARRLVMRDARVREPSWSRSWIAPGYLWGDTSKAPALDVLATVLGGGATSRIYRSLVVEQGLAAGAGASYGGTDRGPSSFQVWATPRNGNTIAQVEAAMEQVLAKVATEGVTEEELARAKRSLIADLVYARDDHDTIARMFGAGLAVGLSVDQIIDWPRRIQAVDAAAVKAAAAAVLIPETSVTGILEPKPAS
jgi:zinc protease